MAITLECSPFPLESEIENLPWEKLAAELRQKGIKTIREFIDSFDEVMEELRREDPSSIEELLEGDALEDLERFLSHVKEAK